MKCTVMIWRSWVQTPVGSNLGCVVLLSQVVLEVNIFWFQTEPPQYKKHSSCLCIHCKLWQCNITEHHCSDIVLMCTVVLQHCTTMNWSIVLVIAGVIITRLQCCMALNNTGAQLTVFYVNILHGNCTQMLVSTDIIVHKDSRFWIIWHHSTQS